MTGGQPDCQETNDDKSVGQAPFFPEEHFKFLHSLYLQRSRITLPLVLVCIKEMEYLSRTKRKSSVSFVSFSKSRKGTFYFL